MDAGKLQAIVEAALLAADEPLTVDQLVKLFRTGEVDDETIRAELRDALKALGEQCESRGYILKRVASGFRFQIRQELSTWISRLWEEKPPRYTRALLETLALVAYRQPVTRGDIEQVRGVSVSQSIMRTLLERNWIRVVGQREVPGRPAMYGTTRAFLDYFDLKSLDQLPPLAEIRELIEPMVVAEADTEVAPIPAQIVLAADQEADQQRDQQTDQEGGQAAGEKADPELVPGAEAQAQQTTVEDAGADAGTDQEVALQSEPDLQSNSDAQAEPDPAEHAAATAQVVEVGDAVTDRDARTIDPEQPTAEVVRLPTTPH